MWTYEARVRMGFNAMVIPVSASGLMLLVALFHVGTAHSGLAHELELEMRSLSELRTDLTRAGHLVEEYATTARTDARLEYRELADRIERNLELATDFDEPDEVRIAEGALAAWDAAQTDADLVFAGAAGVGFSRDDAAVDQFEVAAADIAMLDEVSRAELQETAEGSATTARLVIVAAVIIGALATVTNIALVRRILNATFTPLRHLTEGVSRFSVEDLSHRIEPMGDLEFQAVGASFNEMADRLEDTFGSLEHQAFHDSLTGLPNRASLMRHLRSDGVGDRAIVLFDIDDFKAVNDGLGHAAGDEAIVQVGRRLADAVRPGDFLARLGGDEFVVVLEQVVMDEIEEIAGQIAGQISHAAEIAGRSVVLHASGGIAPAPRGDDPSNILRSADVALYVAKEAGKQCVRLFQPEMLHNVEDRLQMATDLRLALDRGEISVHYQPTVTTGSHAVAGVEALLRWNHPEHGFVPPMTFIPVAEETGQILALGRYVLDSACRQAKAWQQLPGLASLSMNVNVSASQLHTSEIVTDVAAALEQSGLAPASLTLEVTESVMADPDAVARVHEIKELGVCIALDDFGTGYSSMSYLQRLPIDVLKIDKSFIDDIDHRADRAVLANAIVRLGRSLGLVTVAEGVEGAGQLSVLDSVGCDIVQGYLFSRPLPPAEAEDRLLELAGTRPAPLVAPRDRRVRVTVGPLDVTAAREWLHHAHWALDEVEAGRLVPGDVSPAVIAVMRDYVARWSVAAMDSDVFTWTADEDAELLGIMMSRWLRVSSALVAAAANGTFEISEEASAFSHAMVHSLLVALAAHSDDDEAVYAGVLANQWPNQAPTSSAA